MAADDEAGQNAFPGQLGGGGRDVGPPLTTPAPEARADIHPAVPAPPRLRVAYRGEAADLFLVMIKNIFLTLVTLGIYAPWARAVRRRYLWSQVEVGDGQRLEFTGTGKEMFFGYLKLIAGYLLLVVGPRLAVRHKAAFGGLMQLFASLAIMVVIPLAVYWSRRYLLGRTRLRGIRFGLTGDASKFVRLWLGGLVLTVITLGFYGPVFANRVYGALMNNTRYGTACFRYDGPNGRAFAIAMKGLLLSIVTLGIYYFWYRAELQRFRASHTRIAGATASFDVSGGLLFKLTIVNLLGGVLSLGIAIPWTITYTLRTMLQRLQFVGDIDFTTIGQVSAYGNAAGDTLAGALGVELGI